MQPKIVRALFVAGYRLGHACLALQFDKFLSPDFDITYIVTPVPADTVLHALSKHNINLDKIKIIADSLLLEKYPDIDQWSMPGDLRDGWLRQQALKLSALDFIDADIVFLHDPDTFCIKHYCYWDGTKLNLMVLPNESHASGYYQTLQKVLGIQRQTSHCFVTELHPVLKQDWNNLKQFVEKQHSKPFLQAIIDNVPLDFDGLKWFSEYEFLGNWTLSNNSVNLQNQNRFEFETLKDFANFSSHYNCVCNVGADKNNLLFYNYYDSSERISDIDYILSVLDKHIY